MNIKKKRVCNRGFATAETYVELSSSMHLCRLRKGYFNIKIYSASTNYTENGVISVLKVPLHAVEAHGGKRSTAPTHT
jgi:hypothetical protein